jgi:hypothetical protein
MITTMTAVTRIIYSSVLCPFLFLTIVSILLSIIN